MRKSYYLFIVPSRQQEKKKCFLAYKDWPLKQVALGKSEIRQQKAPTNENKFYYTTISSLHILQNGNHTLQHECSMKVVGASYHYSSVCSNK